jgi:phage gpG-like protein
MAKVVWHGAKVYADILDAMDKVNNKVALDVRNEAQSSMRGPKSGRIYRLPGKTRKYRASAPGEAPAARSAGGLRPSILVEFVSKCHRRVGTNKEYGLRLELGDRAPDKNGVYIAARPYLRPALDRAVSKVGGHIQDERL